MTYLMSLSKRALLPRREGAVMVEYWRTHDDAKNPLFFWGEKWLCRSIFVDKTDLGGRFWRRSGRHDPRQRATTSPKLGESDMNVT
jgi:hypothetical protein